MKNECLGTCINILEYALGETFEENNYWNCIFSIPSNGRIL